MKINVETLCEACISCDRLEIETVTSYANDQVCERWFVCKHLVDCKKTKEIIEAEHNPISGFNNKKYKPGFFGIPSDDDIKPLSEQVLGNKNIEFKPNYTIEEFCKEFIRNKKKGER